MDRVDLYSVNLKNHRQDGNTEILNALDGLLEEIKSHAPATTDTLIAGALEGLDECMDVVDDWLEDV